MKNRLCNPYLPLWEYIPDGEPRVFGDRLYLYGSHDESRGEFFCLNDYVVWSAPLSDLSDWVCHGVSYRKDQDPHNGDLSRVLFAPDVVRGVDGRYYLYYSLSMSWEIGVAVSDQPEGPFEFYGHVAYPDGRLLSELTPYDPAVLVEGEQVWLYYGFAAPQVLVDRFRMTPSPGCLVVKLSADMKTVLTEPKVMIPAREAAQGTGFEDHGYFEAPSIRKIRGAYYLVYSSEQTHELCYARSESPGGPYRYGGVIVDNGDLGMEGCQEPRYVPGNNHGGLAEMNGQLYIFYHRHTQGTQFSRQGCAEPVTILPDGSIPQVPVTSSGLLGRPLEAEGTWPAPVCCWLYGESENHRARMRDFRSEDTSAIPAIYEEEGVQFIRNITSGVTVGFRSFQGSAGAITLTLRGNAAGTLEVYGDEDLLALYPLTLDSKGWMEVTVPISFEGEHILKVTYRGKGTLDWKDLAFSA